MQLQPRTYRILREFQGKLAFQYLKSQAHKKIKQQK